MFIMLFVFYNLAKHHTAI